MKMAKKCPSLKLPSCKGKVKYVVVSPIGRIVYLACTWKDAANRADKYEAGHYVYRIEKVKD